MEGWNGYPFILRFIRRFDFLNFDFDFESGVLPGKEKRKEMRKKEREAV